MGLYSLFFDTEVVIDGSVGVYQNTEEDTAQSNGQATQSRFSFMSNCQSAASRASFWVEHE